jgi:hypothetical protein
MSTKITAEHLAHTAYVYIRHNDAKKVMPEQLMVMQSRGLFSAAAASCDGEVVGIILSPAIFIGRRRTT